MSFATSTNRLNFKRSFALLDAPDSYAPSAKGLSLFLNKPSGKIVTQDHVNSKDHIQLLWACVAGVVSAAILIAPANDEIDIELLVGCRATQWQTNIFAPAPFETKPLYKTFSSLQDYPHSPRTVEAMHSYTTDWNPERIVWSVDGSDVRMFRADVVRRFTRTVTSSPLIAALIEDVIIFQSSLSKSSIASTLPLLLVNKLPNLRTLAIQFSAVLVSAAFCHSMTSFPALTALNLSDVTLASITALRRLLTALPRLYDLMLDHVAFETRGIWETLTLYESQMPRVRRLSIIESRNALPVLPLLARHVERLVISVGMLKANAFANLDGLVFNHLTSLTIRSYDALSEGVMDFFSRARADGLRTITVISREADLQSIQHPELLREIFRERCSLEQAVLKTDLRRLESVTVVIAMTWAMDHDYKEGQVAKILKERMPAAVKECRNSLSVLHRRGLLRVAASSLVGRRWDEALVMLWPEEGAQGAPSYTLLYGVPSPLDAIVNFLDKPPS
ncbi:hypothetical protein GSI_13351 [Ganoderma sinense ZZ0214-1]|uniref:GH16 domain-containing protein n=1 Tax=Ganoderma sinense ZZ0214-1 TaxID=1077348 RepID=A0A2G8RVC4_9APHY|nr:hypothetical protein GSI_13351 [Ganoderma sinense ZZ0214-1]